MLFAMFCNTRFLQNTRDIFCHYDIPFDKCLELMRTTSAYINLNFGVPYTFLVLLDTFENIL